MRIACWIPKATNTHSDCVIRIDFPLQQWLQEGASILRYTYIVCLVVSNDDFIPHFWNIKHGNYRSGSEMFSMQELPNVFDI